MAASQRFSATHTIFGFYERECPVSQACSDLIDGMLTISAENRLTVEQVTTCYLLFATYYLLLTTYSAHRRAGYYLLLATCYLLLACCLLPATCYLLLNT